MISIYDLKPAFQKLLRPISDDLAHQGITPNQVTLAALVFSAIIGFLLAIFSSVRWVFFLLPIALLLRMMLNAIDGMMAREHHMQSSLGALLNELGDVLSDAFLYLPFCFVKGVWPFLVVVLVLLSIISELAGVAAVQIGAKRRYDGPMGKSDRAFVFGTIGFLLAIGLKPGMWLNWVMGIMVVLLILTIVNRVSKALNEVQHGN